jgi:hypothetical protein
VFGLYSSLVTLSLSSVAWPTGVGVTLGLAVGLGLAYLLVDRVLLEQSAVVRPSIVRRLASLCCLLWSLVLPLALAAAGLVWGAGSGVGSLVEGPVSTTVRATTHTWLTAANEVGVGALKRLPLAKRLTERELLTVVQAAPDVISAMLDQEKIGAAWQRATGAPMPPQLAAVLRHEFHALTSHHGGEWLHPVVERLRSRTQGGGGPTVQEAIEAMVSPAVFHDAADTIRTTTRRDARNIVLIALALSALLGAGLWLAWTRLGPKRRSEPSTSERRPD